MNRPNIVFGIIGLTLSSYVFFTASRFPVPAGYSVGPGYYPVLLAIGLFILSAVLLVRTLLNLGNETFEKLDIRSPEIIRSFLALLATVVYALAMPYFGFIPASILFLLFLMYLLKNRAYVKMSLIAVGASLAVYFIFSSLLNLTLPQGIFF